MRRLRSSAPTSTSPLKCWSNGTVSKSLIVATPLSSRPISEGALGAGLGYPTRPATLTESVYGGAMITGIQAATIVYLPVALIRGVIAPEEARLIGFKGIYDLFNVALEEDVSSRQDVPAGGGGTSTPRTNWTLSIIGLLSISLGVINLFPIPALDGGRILFTCRRYSSANASRPNGRTPSTALPCCC
jgi:regulator of sigma E protease